MSFSVRQFYDQYPDPDLFAQNLIPPYFPGYTAYLRGRKKADTVLDAGCGSGGVILWAAEQQPETEFTALDFSQTVLEQLSQAEKVLDERNLQFIQGNIEEDVPELTGRTFDLIILSRVLHELTNPVEALRRLKDLLSPKGLLYVSVPSAYAVQPFRDLNPVMDWLKKKNDPDELAQLWTEILIALPREHPVHRSRLFQLFLQGESRFFAPTLFYLFPPFPVRDYNLPSLFALARSAGLHVANIPNHFELEPEFLFTQRGVLDEWGEPSWRQRMEMGELLSPEAPMLELFLSRDPVQKPLPAFDPDVPLAVSPLCQVELGGTGEEREARFEFYNGLGGRFEGTQAHWLEEVLDSPPASANEWKRKGEEGRFRFARNLFERGIVIPLSGTSGEKKT